MRASNYGILLSPSIYLLISIDLVQRSLGWCVQLALDQTVAAAAGLAALESFPPLMGTPRMGPGHGIAAPADPLPSAPKDVGSGRRPSGPFPRQIRVYPMGSSLGSNSPTQGSPPLLYADFDRSNTTPTWPMCPTRLPPLTPLLCLSVTFAPNQDGAYVTPLDFPPERLEISPVAPALCVFGAGQASRCPAPRLQRPPLD